MKAQADNHLKKAAAFIAVAESGDAKRTAYEQAADEILAAQAEDPKLTQVAIGKAIGKSPKWVTDLLGWRPRSEHAPTPWAAYKDDHRYRSAERKVPTRHDDRVEMAEKLLADPDVVTAVLSKPSVAARGVANAVHEKEAKKKEKATEAAENLDEIKKATLSGIEGRLSSMITKINEWALALDSIREDLAGVRPGRQLDLIDRALGNLERAAGESRAVLGYPSKLRVIEGVVGTNESA